jgi:hypothetical protein
MALPSEAISAHLVFLGHVGWPGVLWELKEDKHLELLVKD